MKWCRRRGGCGGGKEGVRRRCIHSTTHHSPPTGQAFDLTASNVQPTYQPEEHRHFLVPFFVGSQTEKYKTSKLLRSYQKLSAALCLQLRLPTECSSEVKLRGRRVVSRGLHGWLVQAGAGWCRVVQGGAGWCRVARGVE